MAFRCYPFSRGTGRLIDRTFISRLKFDEQTIDVRTRDGFHMRVLPNDLIGRQLFYTGQFDRVIPDMLMSLSQPRDVILDVGANVGYVSATLLKRLPQARVIAVEPQPDIFELLERNLTVVGDGRACCIQAALSDCSGQASLVASDHNRGGGHISESGVADGTRCWDVEIIDAKELMKRVGEDMQVNLIKIDVEGHEAQVLRGLQEIIGRDRPRAILFECFTDIRESSNPMRQIFDHLSYEILGLRKTLLGGRLEPLDCGDLAGPLYHDYVAVPVEGVALA
jgi:FkbM family methyltransferase